MQYLTAVLVLVFGTLVVSGELTEFFKSQYEVRGVYKNEDGSLGIKFTSKEAALHIKTLDDITITHLSSAREINKRRARSIYVLDSEYIQHQDDTDKHLDGPKENDTMPFNDAMQELLQMEEVYLLDDAAHAVGEQGVNGVTTPAAMPFFIFAMRITQTILTDSQLYNSTVVKTPEKSVARQKRILGNPLEHFRSSCYKYRRYSDCKGLCGPQCYCWWFVCCNCCYNQGCYDHDTCCERRGTAYHRCFFPIGFQCSSFSC